MTERLSLGLAASFFLAMLGLVLWLGWPTSEHTAPGNQLFVVTTIYPLENFVEHVGGEHVYVKNIVPAGAEPHEYEPSPHDVVEILEADVVFFMGAGLDNWVGETLQADSSLAKLGDGSDPHIWLDPVLAEAMVEQIRLDLISADPDHAADYSANATAYIQELQALDAEYRTGLSGCKLGAIIVSHDATGYLAKRYNFEAYGITGVSPEAEPSVKDLTNLARQARSLKIKTIFFETLVSPELAQTLAKEVGAETAVLNPLEGLSAEEMAADDDYLSVMQANLEALRTAMVCQ